MPKFTKIPQNTFKTMQIEAGVLLYNFDPSNPTEPADEDIICATTGGIKIDCVPSYVDMGEDVDNCPVNTKELKKPSGWECKFGFTSLSISAGMIRLALGAADVDESTGKITPRRSLDVEKDFIDLWWVGDTADGGMAAVCLKNALSTSGLSLQTGKDSKGQISCELTGHVSIDAQDEMPMEFYSAEASA